MIEKNKAREIRVGLFVSLGMLLILGAVLILGGSESFFTRTNKYHVYLENAEGLIPGAKIMLSGLQVGTVTGVDISKSDTRIRADFQVVLKYTDWLRQDSQAEIATQGMLGDKFIQLYPGTSNSKKLEDNSEIPNRPSKDIAQFLNKSDQLLVSLNRIAISVEGVFKSLETNGRRDTIFAGFAESAKNLASVSQKLNSELEGLNLKKISNQTQQILEKVNNGTGTLGSLINDPGLYDDLRNLTGGANRNRIVRNLVRKTIQDNQNKEAEPEPSKKKWYAYFVSIFTADSKLLKFWE